MGRGVAHDSLPDCKLSRRITAPSRAIPTRLDAISIGNDPLDVLVANTRALVPGSVINYRAGGVLVMEDEAGMDEKLIAVPSHKLTQRYDSMQTGASPPPARVSSRTGLSRRFTPRGLFTDN